MNKEFFERITKLSPKRLALLAAELQSKLDTLERRKTEPIAIIGMACRFPGSANSPAAFWQLLQKGVDAISEIPASRWNLDAYYDPDPDAPGKMSTRWGGLLADVDQFDSQFFGIAPREAQSMDPQQRLLLEVSWEALEHAGYSPDHLNGSQTGVFIGVSGNDYFHVQMAAGYAGIDAYLASGNAHSAAAGRLSYTLGLQGPCLAVDTACSSSLVALHLAAQSVRNGESWMALAGGVNLTLSPEVSIALSKSRMMAPDGHCKAFDARADGFVRGEGCGMVVLKRLSDAQAAGDNILALIRGTAINQDGRSNGLTAPNGPSQEAVIRAALANGGVQPQQISYVEAHGTGTSLGDPIEIQALGAVLGCERTKDNPLLVGSVKTNIGHLESAAGIAGLIKTVLALQHQTIPPNLHLQTYNPHIVWDELSITVPTQLTPWSAKDRRRLAGISSFGFSGTNAHVIVEEAPPTQPTTAEVERPLHLLTLSARSQAALIELAKRFKHHLGEYGESIADVCYTANAGRSHFEHRLALIANSSEQLQNQLAAFIGGQTETGILYGHINTTRSPRVVFLFTGQGSQYIDMGRQLYETQPVFRQALDKCNELLLPYLEQSLLSVMYPDLESNSQFTVHSSEPEASYGQFTINETAFTQPALFAFEYALAQLWQSWGIKPAAVMGHSVGEYVAACIAGVFSLEDGLKLIAERGRLMQQLPPGGKMAAIFAAEAQVKTLIVSYKDQVSIAASNGPENVVVSGQGAAVEAVVTEFAGQGIKAHYLTVSHAFHSPLVAPILDAFEQKAASVTYSAPTLELVSNVSGQLATGVELTNPGYWRRHLREPVRFAQSMRTLYEQGYDVFIELGPSPTLLGMGQRCLPEDVGLWLPSLRKGSEDWPQLLKSLGALYIHGVEIDWAGFERPYSRQRVALPTYPFQRERYWVQLDHKLVTEVEELRLKRTQPETPVCSPRQPIDNLLYEVIWPSQPRLEQKTTSSADFILEPGQIASRIQSQVTRLSTQHGMALYEEMLPQLDALCTAYIVSAFQKLNRNFQLRLGQRVSVAVLAEQLGIGKRYNRLLNRMLEILYEDGILAWAGSEWEVCQEPVLREPQLEWPRLLDQYPMFSGELMLTGRCGAQLAEVLREEVNPLQLLFPGGSFVEMEKVYRDSPSAWTYNLLVQEAVTAALSQLPARRVIRILEIGAGTGGTTSYLLPILPPDQVEYVFTDISPLFLNKASQQFSNYSFVRYQVLDIGTDPEAQGFSQHQFDLVIAANVLHATPDLQQTLGHVKKLLAPEGLLILLEGTAPTRFADLTVGLTEGWWVFSDTNLRSYALLPLPTWFNLLTEMGFTAAVAVPDGASEGVMSMQAVILARGPRTDEKKEVSLSSPAGSWIIFADEKGLGQQLAKLIRDQADKCVIVTPGSVYQAIAPDHFQLDPTRSEDFQQLFREILNVNQPPCRGIIHLWSLDVSLTEETSLEHLAQTLKQACGSVLHIVQAVIAAGSTVVPGLWLITRGGQPTSQEELSNMVASQAAIWGLSNTLVLEHPELSCVRIDLDPAAQTDAEIQSLFAEIWQRDPREDQIAFRNSNRHVRRLVRSNLAPSKEPITFRDDSSYLITGGLAGLGLYIAQWMVEWGARYLVLMGRSGASAATRETLSQLEQAGAKFMVAQADVVRQADVARILSEMKQSMPPLRGIIHSAGVLDDGVLLQQSWERFTTVMAPKVYGAWNLHLLTRDTPLDFFVLFSSGASIFGSAGQGNHAAANAFLDMFAYYRRSQGLPAVSINWGAWSKVGTAARRHLDKQQHLNMMAPEEGVQVLERVLQNQINSTSPAQIGAISINWSHFLGSFAQDDKPAFFTEICREIEELETKTSVQTKPLTPELQLAQRLAIAPPDQRLTLLQEHVCRQTARVLGLDQQQHPINLHQPLSDLGLDSLMAIELKNRIGSDLGVAISIVNFLQGYSPAQIAAQILDQLTLASAVTPVQKLAIESAADDAWEVLAL